MYEIFEKLLKDSGITAYKVSKETGISTATLTSWKKGNYTPKADKLQKIADYFGVSMEYLLTGEEDKGVAKRDILLTDQERELLDIFRYLNNPGELLRYARYLKDGEKANERKALDA